MSSAAEDPSIVQLQLSLDRSRKRHLSEGLLRGDQAVDRLRVQEESASPRLTKKPKETDRTPTKTRMAALTADEFRDMMNKQDSKMSRRFDHLDGGLGALKQSLVLVEGAVNVNTAKLASHETIIKANQANIDSVREEIKMIRSMPSNPAANPAGPSCPTGPAVGLRSADFAKARRSLRIWPVPGADGPSVWEATRGFLMQRLELERITEDMIEHIHRPEIPSGPTVKEEVTVLFRATETRDMVMGASAKLAPYIDSNGRPTAGIRIEVPAALRPAFSILFKYGQLLRSRHGPGTRRHVKFDDVEESLFLNVKLPGDTVWSRASLDVARRGLRVRNAQSDTEMERRFDITGPKSDRPRAQSLSQDPGPSTSRTSASAWTGRRTESMSID